MSSLSRSLAVSRRLVTSTLLAVTSAVALPAQQAASKPTLAPLFSVPWGVSIDTLQSRAQALGWEFVQVDDDGDYAFRARIDGEHAMVFATFGPQGLTRVLVSVTPHPAAMVTYQHVADTLRHHIGPAVLSTHDGDRPMPPAPSMILASAWQGVLMGLRRDGRIILVLTCPEMSPRLPVKQGPVT
jgi:hypothetical protein